MALFIPILGELPDGRCACGQPATTSHQVGWYNGPTDADNGPQHEELCEACYADTDAAAHYRREAARANAIRGACERLGIPYGHAATILRGYGAHPRAAEILAAMAPPTDDLDHLLAALLQLPRDADLIGIIGDRLEEMSHPAAAWWRRDVAYGLDERRRLIIPCGRARVEGAASALDEGTHPGIADLCRRLDLLTAMRATAPEVEIA